MVFYKPLVYGSQELLFCFLLVVIQLSISSFSIRYFGPIRTKGSLPFHIICLSPHTGMPEYKAAFLTVSSFGQYGSAIFPILKYLPDLHSIPRTAKIQWRHCLPLISFNSAVLIKQPLTINAIGGPTSALRRPRICNNFAETASKCS